MLDLAVMRDILLREKGSAGHPVESWVLGGRTLDFNRSRALMGVINLSTDSAYQESVCTSTEEAVNRGRSLARAGADLVDLGAESTLPTARRVSPQEQIECLTPVVRALAAEDLSVSVESYWPEVLEAAAVAGARVFNLTGSREAEDVLRLAARHDVGVIHCYVQGETVRDVGAFTFHEDLQGELERTFRARLGLARGLGVNRNAIDAGLGFYYGNLTDGAQRVSHQVDTLLRAHRLSHLGAPVLNILPHAPEVFGEGRRQGAEPFFAVLALLGGSHILRTHEVDAVARVRAAMELYRPDGLG